MASEIRSYTSTQSPLASLRNAGRLFLNTMPWRIDMSQHARHVLDDAREAERLIIQHTATPLTGLKAMEVGTGQLPRQTAFFARNNTVIGIDLDVIPQGIDPVRYFAMLRQNGPGRVVKTLVRKFTGFDWKFRRAVARELARELPGGGGRKLPKYELRQMDAARMTFPDATFDFVYSFDVFEHLPDPASVLKEVVRVLKPRGRVYLSLLPYSAEAGPHDLRVHSGLRGDLPYWAHLRPQHQDKVQSAAYCNPMDLRQWKQVLSHELPGCTLIVPPARNLEVLKRELAAIRAAGELADFPDEDLLHHRLMVIWTKP